MSVHSNIKSLIERYGSKVTIERGNKKVTTKAFIQPLRYKSNVYRDISINMGGFSDGRYYLYIGKAENEFYRADDAIITCNDKQYTVHTSERFELFDRVLYIWAVLKPKKGRRQDAYETN